MKIWQSTGIFRQLKKIPYNETIIIYQEELALIYKSVTLKEDALVQYDEVDALLSQFIINSSGKGKWMI